MNCLLVLSLAVLGASAAPCGVSINAVSNNCLPGPTVVGQTPVVQNPTSFIPGYIPTTSVSQACHCLKTSVRPQIRTEVITVPHIDRLVRIVPSPVVEAVTVNVGGNTRNTNLPTCGINSGISGAVEGVSGLTSGCYPVVSQGVQEVVSAPRFVSQGVQEVVSAPRFVSQGVQEVVASPRIVSQEVVATSCPRIVSQGVQEVVSAPRFVSQGVQEVVSAPRFVSQGVQEVVASPRIVSQSLPAIVSEGSQGIISGSFQGFGGVLNSGIVGCNVV